jgi:hypothetical protein
MVEKQLAPPAPPAIPLALTPPLPPAPEAPTVIGIIVEPGVPKEVAEKVPVTYAAPPPPPPPA